MKGNESVQHSGVMGMHWGVTRASAEKTAYSVGAQINPRELKYKIRKVTNKVTDDTNLLAEYTKSSSKETGILPNNQHAMKAIESVGIKIHAEAVYSNLNHQDITNLKTYTDSARYSRSVNNFLAVGTPKEIAAEAAKLKQTLGKNSINGPTVYRSCNVKFSVNGVAKKLDSMSEEELQKNISSLSKNFTGKSVKETRVFSTSTSPLFAIDTWRAVNPTAASTYNTYMIINCKGTPGVLADGKTSDGKSLVNTRSNQEGILAPNKLTYRKLEFDAERKMFAITVDAT